MQMVEHGRWVMGNPTWGVIHKGRTYLFASEDEKSRFFKNPDSYAPALNGADVVVYFSTGQLVPGQLKHGAFYVSPRDNLKRIFLFNNEASLKEFEQNPTRYTARMRQGPAAAPVGRR